MTTTMADLVADTRRLTYGSMADQLNFLAADTLAGATTLVMTQDIASIVPNSVIACGLNVYYVISTVPATKTVTVYPGYDNSPTVALTAGSPVFIRPRVTDWLLFQNLNDAIRSMSAPTNGLYAEGVWSQTGDPTYGIYEIPQEAYDMTGIIRIRVNPYPEQTLPPYMEIPRYMYEWQPENKTIRLKASYSTGVRIEFLVRLPLVTADALTDDVQTKCGLGESMFDIPPLGAAVSLLRTTESGRAQIHNQGDPRRASEVQQGSNAQIAAALERNFNSRINDEYIRLQSRNPISRGM